MTTLLEMVNSDYVKDQYAKGKYLFIRGHKIHELRWSHAQGMIIPTLVYTSHEHVPLVNRGHFLVEDGEFVNKLIKAELFN